METERKDAPGHTLRTSKTSCKVFRGDVSQCVSVCVCANCLHVCVILSVCAPCTLYCMLCVWLGKYFGRILISSKLLYILLDRTHFATIKYYMKNRKRMTLKMGRRSTHTHTISYSHTHTRTRASQIDRAKLINCKLPVRVL